MGNPTAAEVMRRVRKARPLFCEESGRRIAGIPARNLSALDARGRRGQKKRKLGNWMWAQPGIVDDREFLNVGKAWGGFPVDSPMAF